MKKLIVSLAIAFAAIPTCASASFGVFDMGTLTNTLSTDGVTQSERERAKVQRQSIGQSIMQGTRTGTPKSAVNPSSFTYKISMQRRKANYQSFIDKTMARSPVAGAELKDAFSKGDIIEMARANLERIYGLRTDNVADAYTLWMASTWSVVSGREADVTRTEIQAIRQQVLQSFMSTDGMATATDEVKQNMAEALWVNGFIIGLAGQQVKNNPDARNKLQQAVAANAKRDMGVDLSAITLTDQGFVPRKGGKRGDAGEAMEGAEPGQQGAGQMASAAPSPSSGGMDGADIALLIAAVSAGAGGIFMIGKGISQSRG
jgi:hypothetical protein